MNGQLVIKPQDFGGLHTYGIFLETDDLIEGLECWQECEEIFICYSRSAEGALRAVEEIMNTE